MFKTILIEIAQALHAAQIPYIIIGGQAVLVYGEPRMTRDIDITLGVDIDQLARVEDAFLQSQFTSLVNNKKSFIEETRVLPLEHLQSHIRVDLIFSFSPYEQQAIARARQILFDDVAVSYATPEDVIIHKLFAGRPRDLEDVKGILLHQATLDQQYIQRWLQSFEEVVGRKLVQEYRQLLADIQ